MGRGVIGIVLAFCMRVFDFIEPTGLNHIMKYYFIVFCVDVFDSIEPTGLILLRRVDKIDHRLDEKTDLNPCRIYRLRNKNKELKICIIFYLKMNSLYILKYLHQHKLY